MKIASYNPNDGKMARLGDAVRASLSALADFRDAMRLVNDLTVQNAARPVVEAAELILSQHEKSFEPSIVDDATNLRVLFSQLLIPRVDAELGPLAGLKALRGARSILREELDEIVKTALTLGWQPSEPPMLGIDNMEIAKSRGLDLMLQALVTRMESMERLIDLSIAPQGAPSPERTAIQISLVQVFVKSMKTELTLAKLEVRVQRLVDISVLNRVVQNIGELTSDFVVTIRGLHGKMAKELRETSEAFLIISRHFVSGFKIILKRVAGSFGQKKSERLDWAAPARDKHAPAVEKSTGFDLDKVHEMILEGRSIPPSWRPSVSALDFARKEIKDLRPLVGLTALEEINLDGTLVDDLNPLAKCTSLQWLTLNRTFVSDLAPLAGLTSLQRLYLNNTKVSDITHLGGLAVLERLDLNDTQVGDLSPLVGLKLLKRVELKRTEVVDLSPLEGLSCLERIDLDYTRVSDVGPLSRLFMLHTLFLDGTEVDDVTPLAQLNQLQWLDLDRTPVKNLMPLAALSALKRLDINFTNVASLTALSGLKELTTVFVESEERRAALIKTFAGPAEVIKIPEDI